MSESKEEEIIGTLWLIAALLAFNGGYNVAGWLLLIKSAMDILCSVVFAIRKIIKKGVKNGIEFGRN